MKSLHYLTVQDLLWIHLQITGKVETYRFADLEEATFYQYAYGQSTSLVPQAARFLAGFVHKAPLASANEATAFLATLTFLEINGRAIDLGEGDAVAWFKRATSRKEGVPEEIDAVASHQADDHGDDHGRGTMPNIKATVRSLMARYAEAVSSLSTVPA